MHLRRFTLYHVNLEDPEEKKRKKKSIYKDVQNVKIFYQVHSSSICAEITICGE